MLKFFRYFSLLAACVFAASCSDDEGNGAGDATIGFGQAAYSYRESEGTVRIPVVFTGEPKSYPITFNVQATVDAEKGMIDGEPVTVDQVAHFIQTENFRYIGNPDAPVFIEVDLKDNSSVNDTRYLTLAITSVEGAEVVNGETTIEIRDNDANAYDRLMGRWSVQSINADEGTRNPTWITYIMDGFTDEEAEKNRAANKLMCYGFGGYSDTPGGGRFIWYLDYNYDEVTGEGSLSLDMTHALINVREDVFGVGVNPTMVVFSTMSASSGDGMVDLETPIYATWSNDFNTITFDPETQVAPLIFSDGQYTDKYMGMLGRIIMKRVD